MNTKILVVGDPHIRPEDIAEGERLIGFVAGLVKDHKPDVVFITGDLYHYHGIVHVEVMEFWQRALDVLTMANRDLEVILLRGNHDGPHDVDSGVNSLIAHKGQSPRISVIERPIVWEFKNKLRLLFVPYTHDGKEFVDVCKQNETSTVYCHQTFNGGRYDNGFYAKEGVEPDAIPQTQVISGHIHTPQEFGKVWYVGSPRWMTASDANQDRMVWLVEHDETGKVVGRQSFETDKVCSPIVQMEDTPEAPASAEKIEANYRVYVTIRGPMSWCQKRKAFWQGKARYRTLPTDGRRVAVKESEGISMAFRKFLTSYQPAYGTPPEVLEGLCRERLNLLIQA